jgi:hypothetical protein
VTRSTTREPRFITAITKRKMKERKQGPWGTCDGVHLAFFEAFYMMGHGTFPLAEEVHERKTF